jgi:hypothetical protein
MKARLLFFVFISLVILIVACERKSPGNKTVKSNSGQNLTSGVQLQNSFYKRFEGTIGKKKIVMNLMRIDTTLLGNYHYADSLQPIPFSFKSNITQKGKFFIEAGKGFDNYYDPDVTGIFNGSFISENEIKGTWDKPGSDVKMDFDLVEKYPEGSSEFEIISYHKKIPQGEAGKKGFAEITIAHPTMINSKKNSVQKEINKYLSTSLLKSNYSSPDAKPFNDYDEMLTDFFYRYDKDNEDSKNMKMGRNIYYNNLYEINILNNSENILSTRETVSTYEGGAHPNTNFSFNNFDLHSGKEIKLSDVFKGNYESVLNKIAEKKFRKLYKIPENGNLEKAGFYFHNGVFKLNDNYSFSRYAVTFQFNPYEVAAYALGAPEITIPYSEIRDIIKPDGLLGKFIK